MEAAAFGHLDLTVAGGEFGVHPDLPYIGGLEGDRFVWTRDCTCGAHVGITEPRIWSSPVSVTGALLGPA